MPSGVYKHKPHPEEWKRKISRMMMGNKYGLGYRHNPEQIEKIRQASLKSPARYYWLGKTGEQSANWKGGITPRFHHPNNKEYTEWRSEVFKRENWKCRINNKDCRGQIQAHHILSWRDFPELRYDVNNGITLCQAHHPRRWAEEKRLIPVFQGLVSVSKELLFNFQTR